MQTTQAEAITIVGFTRLSDVPPFDARARAAIEQQYRKGFTHGASVVFDAVAAGVTLGQLATWFNNRLAPWRYQHKGSWEPPSPPQPKTKG